MSISIRLDSEIGALDTVVVHTPGPELENMTPATAAEVLYDDILSLPLALDEHRQLKGVLEQVSRVLEFRDLLADVLDRERVRRSLIEELCELFRCPELIAELDALESAVLARQLI